MYTKKSVHSHPLLESMQFRTVGTAVIQYWRVELFLAWLCTNTTTASISRLQVVWCERHTFLFVCQVMWSRNSQPVLLHTFQLAEWADLYTTDTPAVSMYFTYTILGTMLWFRYDWILIVCTQNMMTDIIMCALSQSRCWGYVSCTGVIYILGLLWAMTVFAHYVLTVMAISHIDM